MQACIACAIPCRNPPSSTLWNMPLWITIQCPKAFKGQISGVAGTAARVPHPVESRHMLLLNHVTPHITPHKKQQHALQGHHRLPVNPDMTSARAWARALFERDAVAFSATGPGAVGRGVALPQNLCKAALFLSGCQAAQKLKTVAGCNLSTVAMVPKTQQLDHQT